MKPVQLKMTAFGPYKYTETIDFTKLQDQRIFVISGATGAGKTTIFDGICFALYGQASGTDRTDIRALRSDFAEDATQTSVDLLFTIHNRTYRIFRQIPYTKKGNKSETSARCELYEITEEGETPFVDRQIVSEVNKKVEQLIGFSQAQFSQIVMLPQGEFRKFLTSNTDNKQEIMRKIFKTEPYLKMAERLKEQKDHVQAELTKQMQKREDLYKQLPSMLPARESNLFATLSTEQFNVYQIIESLQEEIDFYYKKTAEDQAASAQANEKHGKQLEKYHKAKQINERFMDLEQKEQQLAALEKQAPLMKERELQLAKAERAAAIYEIEKQWQSWMQDAKNKEKVMEEKQTELKIASEAMERALQRFETEEKRAAERTNAAEQLLRLEDHLPTVANADETKHQLAKRKLEIDQKKEVVLEQEKEIAKKNELSLELKNRIDQLDEQLLTYDEHAERLQTLKEQCKWLQGMKETEQLVKQLTADRKQAEEAYKRDREIYEQAEQLWLNNQAAALAEHLHDGEACPVCGSVKHPALSQTAPGDEEITRGSLQDKKKQLDHSQHAYQTLVLKCDSAQKQLQEQESGNEAKEEYTVLLQLKKETEEIVQQLRKMKEELLQLRKKSKEHDSELAALLEEQKKRETQLAELESSYRADNAVYKAAIDKIPEDVRQLEVLQQKITSAKKELQAMEKAWKEAQQGRESAKERFQTAESAERHAAESAAESAEKRAAMEQRFEESLLRSDFANNEEYQSAKLEEEQRHSLQESITEYKKQFTIIEAAVLKLREDVRNEEKKDLTALHNEAELLKKEYEQKLADQHASAQYYKQASEVKRNIEQTSEEIAAHEKTFAKVTDLHDVLRGQNSKKLSFERYIQIDFLERILIAANGRLRTLSNGQFELLRSDRMETHGKQSGLGLDIYDAYTGTNRDVKTLSGGEKFNASLCLALGMADVIQSFQGGVSIDTMFIDEGFGSLDEEALRKAIDTLIELQKTGRMIGVISHVEELKAAFPAILKVEKKQEGYSTARFEIK